jgi:hypothetical protein
VFHQRPNFSAGARITYVVQFEGEGHFNSFYEDTASLRSGDVDLYAVFD